MLLEDEAKFIMSAFSLFAASSNEILVLVLDSKNRFKIVLPLKAGTFFKSLSRTSLKVSAFSRIRPISSIERSAISMIFFTLNMSYCLFYLSKSPLFYVSLPVSSIDTLSWPSVSDKQTSINSPKAVGIFFPT